jgi:hypothetical protein
MTSKAIQSMAISSLITLAVACGNDRQEKTKQVPEQTKAAPALTQEQMAAADSEYSRLP